MAKRGRPIIPIDPKQVEALAAINCTVEEIACVLNVDKRTIERRFMPHLIKGRENGKSSLRRMMYEKAKEGNVVMMIFLSKNMLGYSDKVEQKTEYNGQSQVVVIPSNGREQIKKD